MAKRDLEAYSKHPYCPPDGEKYPHIYFPLIYFDLTFLIFRTILNKPNEEEDKATHFEHQGCNFNESLILMDGEDLDEDDKLEIPNQIPRLIEQDDNEIASYL